MSQGLSIIELSIPNSTTRSTAPTTHPPIRRSHVRQHVLPPGAAIDHSTIGPGQPLRAQQDSFFEILCSRSDCNWPIPSDQTSNLRRPHPESRQRNPREPAPQPPDLASSGHLPPADHLVPLAAEPSHRSHHLRHRLRLRHRLPRLPAVRLAPGIRQHRRRVRRAARRPEIRPQGLLRHAFHPAQLQRHPPSGLGHRRDPHEQGCHRHRVERRRRQRRERAVFGAGHVN